MNKILKNFLAILSGNVIGKLLFFVFSVFIARVFGEEVFGSINFANSIVSYFLMISSMGLQTYAVIRIAKNKELKEVLVNKILSIRIILALISLVLLILILALSNIAQQNKIMTILYGSIIITNALNIDWYFNAIQKMKYISFSIIIQNVVSLLILFIIYFVNISKSMYVIPICIFIGNIVSVLYSIYIVSKEIKFKFIFSIKESLFFIKKSFPFFFSGIFATINCNIDIILIGIFHTNLQVGLYSSAYKIINILVIGVAIIFTPVYPVMIELISEKKINEFNLLINNLKRLILTIIIPIVVGGILLKEQLIIMFFTEKYIKAANSFAILLIYIGLLYLREIYGYILNASGKQKLYMKVVSVSATTNIILNIILIPIYGIEGAAFTTVISEMLNLLVMKKYSSDLIKSKFDYRLVFKIFIATLVMTLIIYVLKRISMEVVIILSISIILYLSLAFLFRIFKLNDITKLLGGRK